MKIETEYLQVDPVLTLGHNLLQLYTLLLRRNMNSFDPMVLCKLRGQTSTNSWNKLSSAKPQIRAITAASHTHQVLI